MDKEAIIILDEGMDDPFGPESLCCSTIIMPFRA